MEEFIIRSLATRQVCATLHYPYIILCREQPELQASYLAQVNTSMKKFEKVKQSPSLQCKLVLTEAELARISGDLVRAQELYDESIAIAKECNYLHIVG